MIYEPKTPFKFEDGRCVLYRNRQYMFTNWYLYSNLTSAMLYFAILIKRNPCTVGSRLSLSYVPGGFAAYVHR